MSEQESSTSILDKLHWTQAREIGLSYEGGVLGDVIAEIEDAFLFPPEDQRGLLVRVTHPPRILRALLDLKIEQPELDVLPFIFPAIDLTLSVYRGDPDALQQVRGLRQQVGNSSHAETVFYAPADQPHDTISFDATMPEYSQATAERLVEVVANEGLSPHLLIIPLGHGSTAAGIDVLLRYREKTHNKHSEVFPVRFSRHKRNDRIPQVNQQERNYLGKMGQGRTVVIFDDDSFDPNGTLAHASQYFVRNVFSQDQPLKAMANRYYRL